MTLSKSLTFSERALIPLSSGLGHTPYGDGHVWRVEGKAWRMEMLSHEFFPFAERAARL